MSGRRSSHSRRTIRVVDSDDDDKKVQDDEEDATLSPIVLVPKLCDIGQELLVDIMEQNDPKKLGKAMQGLVNKIRLQYQEDNESDANEDRAVPIRRTFHCRIEDEKQTI